MIESLLAPGSILELVIYRCVPWKDPLRFFLLVPSRLPDLLGQHEERLVNRTQTRVFCVGMGPKVRGLFP